MKDLNWLKESVAALIALGIVGFTLYALHHLLSSSNSAEQWQRMSSVLQVAVGLAGTVTGYYFGRIPAEKAANQAVQALKESSQRTQQAETSETRLRSQVDLLQRKYSATAVEDATATMTSQEAVAIRKDISDELARIV